MADTVKLPDGTAVYILITVSKEELLRNDDSAHEALLRAKCDAAFAALRGSFIEKGLIKRERYDADPR